VNCNPNPSNSQPNSTSFHHNFTIMSRIRLFNEPLFRGSETMTIEGNHDIENNAPLFRGNETMMIGGNHDAPREVQGNRTFCMFINNWFYNIYNNESYQYISSFIVNWLCVITMIYIIYLIVLSDQSLLVKFFEIIISCLGIMTLQSSNMFDRRLQNNMNTMNTQMNTMNTQMNTMNTRMEDGFRQGFTQMNTMNTRMEDGFEQIIQIIQRQNTVEII